MRLAKIVGLVLAGAAAGCRGEPVAHEPVSEAVAAAPSVAAPVADVSAAGRASPEAAPVAAASPPIVPEGARTAIGAWGVEIAVPAGAKSVHEAAAERHTIYLRYGVQVGLNRIDLAAPASLQEALKPWDQDDELRKLGEGTTPEGVHYAVRAFQVRDGRSSGGQHVHFFLTVARVYAVMAVGEKRRVECTGYVEHDVDGPDDPDLVAVREVCLSLRRV
jgi:hypothetical protein